MLEWVNTRQCITENFQIKKQVYFYDSTRNNNLKSPMSLELGYNPIIITMFFSSIGGGGFESKYVIVDINNRKSQKEKCFTFIYAKYWGYNCPPGLNRVN